MKKTVKIIIKLLLKYLFIILRIYNIKKNKIVFCNSCGNGYGCNLKYIAEEIIRQELDYDLVWLVKSNNYYFPEKIRIVKYNSIKSFYELATAKIWIDNQNKNELIQKRKGQYNIQAWHGGYPLKRLGIDNPENNSKKNFIYNSKIIDLRISNCTFRSNIFRTAYLYKGEILECGLPRNDVLINKQEHKTIRKKILDYYNISDIDILVLYAPTYRSNLDINVYTLNYQMLIEYYNIIGLKCKILIRLHHDVAKKQYCLTYNDEIMNATNYSDIQELMCASDILITDYSNIMFEFALMYKPCFLFATDIYEYLKNRGFYFDYFNLPFRIADDTDKLIDNIRRFDMNLYIHKIEKYMDMVGAKEFGNASKQVVERIKYKIENKI